MKLQKLAYVAHGWYLAFVGEPLVHDVVEAWKWGPVFRSLYREFRDYGSQPITRRARAFDGGTLEERECSIRDGDPHQIKPEATEAFLDSVWDIYGKFTAGQLSDITHQPGTPWSQVVQRMGGEIMPFTTISNNMIEEHYKKLLHERKPGK